MERNIMVVFLIDCSLLPGGGSSRKFVSSRGGIGHDLNCTLQGSNIVQPIAFSAAKCVIVTSPSQQMTGCRFVVRNDVSFPVILQMLQYPIFNRKGQIFWKFLYVS